MFQLPNQNNGFNIFWKDFEPEKKIQREFPMEVAKGVSEPDMVASRVVGA